LWLLGSVLVGLATVLAMAGPVLVRRRVGFARLSVNNEIAELKFGTVGGLDAVLLAFAISIVWGKFSDADTAAAQEAAAVATLYRLADGIAGDPGTALRDRTTQYARSAVTEDWPAMELGGGSQATMTGVLTFLIFSGLFVVIAIDHPFAGSVKVGPEALAAVLENFGPAARP